MIIYLKGDATSPIGEGMKLIIHVCNDKGAWGAGFVMALSRKWKAPEDRYRDSSFKELGLTQFVYVENDIVVANMIAQTLLPRNYKGDKIPLNYGALSKCLTKVNYIAKTHDMTIHAPRFGSGIAGGNWNIIEQMINDIIKVDVFIYDLE